jgi:hypothetical protein
MLFKNRCYGSVLFKKRWRVCASMLFENRCYGSVLFKNRCCASVLSVWMAVTLRTRKIQRILKEVSEIENFH